MGKKVFRIILSIVLIVGIFGSVFVFALDIKNDLSKKTRDCLNIMTNTNIKCAAVHNVDETGSNFRNVTDDTNGEILENDSVSIKFATIQDKCISISGSIYNKHFMVSGVFCGISENKNVLVYNAKDETKSFRVVYCAIERDLNSAALYFRPIVDRLAYTVVTKLYLAPVDIEGEYIVIEIYGKEFPEITEDDIEQLPEKQYLSLFWYAKEFKPKKVLHENEPVDRAGNSTICQVESYFYNHLGMEISHHLRHWQYSDIRDVTHNQSSTASATFEISDMWITAPLPNDCSSTYCNLALKEVSIVYLTKTQTAVQWMMTTGTITQGPSIVSSFTYNMGVGVTGLNVGASLSFTWEPGNNNKSSGINYNAYTNSPTGYWREAEGKLKSNQYLGSIGNKYTANWIYSSYSSATSSGNASLVYKYLVYNMLDYTQSHSEVDIRTFNVNVT